MGDFFQDKWKTWISFKMDAKGFFKMHAKQICFFLNQKSKGLDCKILKSKRSSYVCLDAYVS